MGEMTGISWTHHTFNPWAGCTKVSPACDNCYAEKDTKRRGFVEWGKDATRRRTSAGYWNQLAKWNREAKAAGERRRVFIGSWCDIMEDRAELQPIREELYPLIKAADWLDVLLLTKRPQNFRRFLPAEWLANPLPNVWGMTTVESEQYMWRATALLETPFAVRGLSIEPLLGPVYLYRGLFHHQYKSQWSDVGNGSFCGICGFRQDERKHPVGIDWVICGGESQHGARPMQAEWARSLRDQCVEAGVAFHFKQWGEWLPDSQNPLIQIASGSTQATKVGKKAAGHLLDGREWQEFPGAEAPRG